MNSEGVMVTEDVTEMKETNLLNNEKKVQERIAAEDENTTIEDDELSILQINLEEIPDVGENIYLQQVSELIENYKPKYTQTTKISTKIILEDETPIYQSPRRLSIPEKKEVEEQIREWLEKKIIRPSCSDFASPIVLVKKKNGSTRICVDYRKLNKKIVKDRYPLPVIEDQIDKLSTAMMFTILDLRNGFFHVPVAEESIKYTAFVTPSGQYEFLKTPFGLCNSPAIFQRFINEIFKDLMRDEVVIIYMDDLIIPSKNVEEGFVKLHKVIGRAEEFGLEFNWKKCKFLQKRIEYLGHDIEAGKVRPSLTKIAAVQNFPEPTTIKTVQSFLGLTGYFRKFIKDYALIARPLSDILKGKREFKFGPEEKASFEELKRKLSEEPVLKIFDFESATELHTDASQDGFGAILFQKDDEKSELHPVYFWSRKTNDAQRKYHSYELEVLAVIEAIKRFRVYLLGIKFTIVTDCAAFTMTMNKKDLSTRVARWALLLEEFNYSIIHRPGMQMKHCDALSRNPIAMIVQNEFFGKLRKAQERDDQLRAIMKILHDQPYEGYLIDKNLLYKEENGQNLLVIPTGMQEQIIKNAHENGHFASKKTSELISREYYIPKLENKIKKVIANCIPCILAERKTGKQEGLLHPIPKGDKPLQVYHADHVGPLDSTKKGYRYLLVIIDGFSKFVWLHPTKTTNAKEVLNKFEDMKQVFGNPRTIITDRGSAFTCTDFQQYCTDENIKHINVTTGVPRGNGQVERINRIIIPVLTKLSFEKPEAWYRQVRPLQEALNSTHQRSINTSPFELLFGVKMLRSEDIRLQEVIEEEYAKLFIEERDELRKEAKQQIKKIQEENIKNYNRKRKMAREYKPGDQVAIKRTQFKTTAKILPKYLGPYEVIKKIGNDRYDVKKIGTHDGPRTTKSCAEMMKPWCQEDLDSFEANEFQDGRVVGNG
jgi:transposase InsO family protein